MPIAKAAKSAPAAPKPVPAQQIVPKSVKPADLNRSKLVRMSIANIGCIGPSGIEIALDDIVCLVGVNNCGKSTVLRAYEAAVNLAALTEDDIHRQANGGPAVVELWVHIPLAMGNIAPKWKEREGELLLVRSKWEWPKPGAKPTRTTWDPEEKKYAEDGKAAGVDTVFTSRLPKPFRIGSLAGPEQEHKRLVELIVEPIKAELLRLMGDDTSDLRARIDELQREAEKPVAAFRSDVDEVQGRVNKSYTRVFSRASVHINVALGDLQIDPARALIQGSKVEILEGTEPVPWHCQGTGSQRTLFWSMLEVRSELRRRQDERKQRAGDVAALEKNLREEKEKLTKLVQDKAKATSRGKIVDLEAKLAAARASQDGSSAAQSEVSLPGHMLLIDEPETALHPSAVRAAKDYLYELAADPGWQVMLSTHHPAFIDPIEKHTTIVRLHRPDEHSPPDVYRAGDVFFDGDDEQNLKALLAFDQSVSEMFFSHKVVIVEGDTEFAAFTVVMDSDKAAFPVETRPLILRARGKATIPPLVRILAHFRVGFAVLNDVDSPRAANGSQRNPAYTTNAKIARAVEEARAAGVQVVHRDSVPNFERKHQIELSAKDKPFRTWKSVTEDVAIRKSVRSVLDALCQKPAADCTKDPDDGQHYEARARVWASQHAVGDDNYNFDGT